MSDHPQALTDVHDPDLTTPGGPRRQIRGRVVGGAIAIVAVVVALIVGVDPVQPTATRDATAVETLGLTADEVLFAADHLAGSSQLSTLGVDTPMTLHVRCEGTSDLRLRFDGATTPLPDPVPCDGEVRAFDVRAETSINTVSIDPEPLAGSLDSWALAATE